MFTTEDMSVTEVAVSQFCLNEQREWGEARGGS